MSHARNELDSIKKIIQHGGLIEKRFMLIGTPIKRGEEEDTLHIGWKIGDKYLDQEDKEMSAWALVDKRLESNPVLVIKDKKNTIAGWYNMEKTQFYDYDNAPIKAFIFDKEGVLEGWINPSDQFRGIEGFKHNIKSITPAGQRLYKKAKEQKEDKIEKTHRKLLAIVESWIQLSEKIKDNVNSYNELLQIRGELLRIDPLLKSILSIDDDYSGAFLEGLWKCLENELPTQKFIQKVTFASLSELAFLLTPRGIEHYISIRIFIREREERYKVSQHALREQARKNIQMTKEKLINEGNKLLAEMRDKSQSRIKNR